MKLRIAHTADWHIRPRDRHDEYERVFENLKSDLLERKVDMMFVAGDVFHSKLSGISPEYIRFLPKVLKSLAESCEIHLMLGNHDCNLASSSKLDAVSPIIELMRDERVILHRTTETFEKGGAVFHVFSPLDESEWKKLKPAADLFNVACFHGPVRGAKTALGWTMESELAPSDFSDFDLVLLGDIHKTQFLGPRIAYPGSLIQQDWSEDAEHGYLLWTLDTVSKSCEVEFVPIRGAMPFMTLQSDGIVELPSSSRVRIIGEMNDERKGSLIAEARRNGTILTFVERDRPELESFDSRIFDGSSLVDLARQELKENSTNESEIEILTKMISSYQSNLSVSPDLNPRRWTLSELKFDNINSYGTGNSIDFSRARGLIGLVGPNFSGKSSILTAILYCLFNRSDRDASKNASLVNSHEETARAECVVSSDDDELRIVRKTSKSPGGSSTTKLTVVSMKDGDLTGEQRSETDKTMKNRLGDVEHFLLTSLAAQDDMTKFLREGSASRNSSLSEILGLDVIAAVHDAMKRDLSPLRTERKVISPDERAVIQSRVNDLTDALARVETSLVQKREQHEELERVYVKRLGEVGSRSRGTIHHELETSKVELQDIERILEEQLVKSRALEERRTVLDKFDDELSKTDFEGELKKVNSLKESRAIVSSKLNLLDESISRDHQAVRQLEDVPCGGSFPHCKFIASACVAKQRLPENEMKSNDLRSEMKEMDVELSGLKFEDIIKLVRKRDENSRERIALEKELSTILSRAEGRTSRKLALEQKIEKLRDELRFVPENDDVEKLRDEVSQLRRELDNLISERSSLAKTLEHEEQKVKRCRELDDRIILLEKLVRLFSRDGLQGKILASRLSRVNSIANSFLEKVGNLRLEVRSGAGGALEVMMQNGDGLRLAELGSGMERTMVSLALRVALRDVSLVPMADFMVIDEGFVALDAENRATSRKLLEELRRVCRFVLIVTHDESVKDSMDDTIEVCRSDGRSRLNGGIAC